MQSYVFDAYGRLFDVTSAPTSHSAALGPRRPTIVYRCRAKQLGYAWVRAAGPQVVMIGFRNSMLAAMTRQTPSAGVRPLSSAMRSKEGRGVVPEALPSDSYTRHYPEKVIPRNA